MQRDYPAIQSKPEYWAGGTHAVSISQRPFSHSLKKTCLNRFAVPSCCAIVSLPHSTTHPENPYLNSSLWRSSYLNPYIFLDVHNHNDWRIYSSSDTSYFQLYPHIRHNQLQPALPSKQDTSFPLECANESASGGKLRSINLQSYSPKHKAWHSKKKNSLIWTVAKVTPWWKKLWLMGPEWVHLQT